MQEAPLLHLLCTSAEIAVKGDKIHVCTSVRAREFPANSLRI